MDSNLYLLGAGGQFISEKGHYQSESDMNKFLEIWTEIFEILLSTKLPRSIYIGANTFDQAEPSNKLETLEDAPWLQHETLTLPCWFLAI